MPLSLESLAAIVGCLAGLSGGFAAMYYRSASLDLEVRLAVAEAKLIDIRVDVRGNYDYCHKATHDLNNSMTIIQGRMRVMEHVLKIAPFEGV